MRKLRINPLDLKSNVAIGVNVPFNGNGVFSSTYTSKEATRANLVNFFLTNQDERVFNPSFGANLRKYIFENSTEVLVNEINELITNGLDLYFPRILVKELKVTPDVNNNMLYILLSYSIIETNIEDQIVLSFER